MINMTKLILIGVEIVISMILLLQGWRMLTGKVFVSPTARLGLLLVKLLYGPDVAAEKLSSLETQGKQRQQGIRAMIMGLVFLIIALITIVQN